MRFDHMPEEAKPASASPIEVVEAHPVPPLEESVKMARAVAIACGAAKLLPDDVQTKLGEAIEDLIASASALEVQYRLATQTIYRMHVAATGDPNQPPVLGLAEDVAYMRERGNNAAKAARAAVDGWEAYEAKAEKTIATLRERRDRAVQLIASRLDPKTDALLMKQLEALAKDD